MSERDDAHRSLFFVIVDAEREHAEQYNAYIEAMRRGEVAEAPEFREEMVAAAVRRWLDAGPLEQLLPHDETPLKCDRTTWETMRMLLAARRRLAGLEGPE